MTNHKGTLIEVREALDDPICVFMACKAAGALKGLDIKKAERALAKLDALIEAVPRDYLREGFKSHHCLALELPEVVYDCHTEKMHPVFTAAKLLADAVEGEE